MFLKGNLEKSLNHLEIKYIKNLFIFIRNS